MPSEMARKYTEVAVERDAIRRLFNRLEAAVTHHHNATEGGFRDDHDTALYKARDKVLADYHEGRG